MHVSTGSIDLAGRTVVFVGRMSRASRRAASRLLALGGARVRRAVTRRTDAVVVGYHAISQLRDGRLRRKLDQAEAVGAVCLSELAFIKAVAAPTHPFLAARLHGPVESYEAVGLTPSVLQILILFDVLLPDHLGGFGFRDLVEARAVRRLIEAEVPLHEVIEAAHRLRRRHHSLARSSVVIRMDGSLGLRLGDRVADLDGQLSLPFDAAPGPSADDLFDAGEAAEAAGNLEEAESLYRRCIAMDPFDPIAPFNLSNVLRERGQLQDARNCLVRTLGRDPEFAEAWYNLAHLDERSGRPQDARLWLRRALEHDPAYADALFNLAQLEFRIGDFAAAIDCWNRYLALDPEGPAARVAKKGIALAERSPRVRIDPGK